MSQLFSAQSASVKAEALASQLLSIRSAQQLILQEICFDDYFWNDAFSFLKQHATLNQRFLLPDELCNIFENTVPYCQTEEARISSEIDWALIHKGRIRKLSVKFLEEVCRSFTPTFANEVFVLFSNAQLRFRTTSALRHSSHVEALLVKLREQKRQQVLQHLTLKRPPLKQNSGRRKPTLLIETGSGAKDSTDPPEFVPLSWAATSGKYPYANLGDALSPILVSALSGLPVVHRDFDSWQRRLACVGTIAHGFKQGAVHFWGTGLDPKKSPVDTSLSSYQRPANTNFHVHAVRGVFTAQVLKSQGIDVPPIYGDPVWFLPSIIPPAPEKQYELGVVVHLTELAERSSTASVDPNLVRYHIPPALQNHVRIITTLTEPSFEALEARVQEMTACKRIVSTSLHGLVISETYGIPCVPLCLAGRGARFVRLDNDRERIDRRVRDFYSGMGVETLFVYGQRRHEPTHWEELMDAIDRYWQPLVWSADSFLDAFPLPLAFNPLGNEDFKHRALLEKIQL